MKTAIEKKLISGIVIAIVSVLAIVFFTLFQSRSLQDTSALLKHTNQVIYLTQEVLDVSQRYELEVKNTMASTLTIAMTIPEISFFSMAVFIIGITFCGSGGRSVE